MAAARRVPALLATVATGLAVLAIWLTQDNPDIVGTSRGDDYTCLAPYDTVLNGADNFPGGEPPPDGDEIASRCRDAGQERFTQAVGAGVGALLTAIAAVVAGRSKDRRAARSTALER